MNFKEKVIYCSCCVHHINDILFIHLWCITHRREVFINFFAFLATIHTNQADFLLLVILPFPYDLFYVVDTGMIKEKKHPIHLHTLYPTSFNSSHILGLYFVLTVYILYLWMMCALVLCRCCWKWCANKQNGVNSEMTNFSHRK